MNAPSTSGCLRVPDDTRAQDARPQDAWKHLYGTERWRNLRIAFLAEHPLCGRCLTSGIVEPATVVHHIDPHKGDLEKFWGGPFEGLCAPHHNSQGQLEDHGKRVIQFGPDGWPI